MGRYTAHLVGESNYQAAVKRLRAGAPVELVPEPGNPHDPRAIRAASLDGATIGYVERDSWLTGALLDQKVAAAARVHELIGGGRGGKTGVVLEVVTAGDAEQVVAAGWDARLADRAAQQPPASGGLLNPVSEGDRERNNRQGLVGFTVMVIVGILALAMCDSPDTPGDVAESAQVAKLPPEKVTQCRELIATGERIGLIKARPERNRINVDDAMWAQLPADVKDQTLAAVSCDVWQTALPSAFDYVVAYGYRSGKRVQMLTSEGMVRE